MRQMCQVWKERKTTVRSFRPLHSTRYVHLACNLVESLLITRNSLGVENDYLPEADFELEEQKLSNGVFSEVIHDAVKSPYWLKIFYLFHRLFEAHFLPTHMALLVVASSLYMWVVKGKPDDLGVAWTFALTNYLRIIGFAGTAVYMIFYEQYHSTCTAVREAEMRSAGLAEHMVFSRRKFPRNLIDYAVFPLVAPLYGSIPAIQAQLCHFWTQDLVYAVSNKPSVLRQRAKSLVQEVLGA